MSASEKTFSFIKTILTYHERLDGLDEKLKGLSEDLGRLAGSHGNLRDRVGQIEGYLKGATQTPFNGPTTPRIEG